MDSKINFVHQNQVWYLIDLCKVIIPIGCKWISNKIDDNEQVDTFKARLVEKVSVKDVLTMMKYSH